MKANPPSSRAYETDGTPSAAGALVEAAQTVPTGETYTSSAADAKSSSTAVPSSPILTARRILKRQVSSPSPTTDRDDKSDDQDVNIQLPASLHVSSSSNFNSRPPLPTQTPPSSVPPSPTSSAKATKSSPPSQQQQQRLLAPRLVASPSNTTGSIRPIKQLTRASSRDGSLSIFAGSSSSSSRNLLDNTLGSIDQLPSVPALSTINHRPSNSENSGSAPMNKHRQQQQQRKNEDRYHPVLMKILQRSNGDHCFPLIPTPRSPAKCPLFCCFYAEFDNKVGPTVVYQSPKNFMNHDIQISTEKIHELLARTFSKYTKQSSEDGNNKKSKRNDTHDEMVDSTSLPDDVTPFTDTKSVNTLVENSVAESPLSLERASMPTASEPTPNRNSKLQDGAHRLPNKKDSTGKDKPRNNNKVDADAEDEVPFQVAEGALSIFDSTSEYIITGHELCDKTINLSTHGMHILTRPTVIHDERYARNSLLFSVGFVLRRAADPSPFRPLLSKWSLTLRSMEIESQILSNPTKRPQLQMILERILISLNGAKWECNLILNPSNSLNLKLYHPPKPVATPVRDHEVPILLRRDLHLQMFDWDLAINWVILHIDGVTNARLISIKAEVDIELVRACLRVLKHHGVIVLVDMFLYTNRYEFTPRASSMLAGNEPKLLQEAVDFCIKSSRSVVPSFQIVQPGATSVTGSGGGFNINNNSPGGTGGSGFSGGGGSQSDSSAATTNLQLQQQQFSLGTSPFNNIMSQQQTHGGSGGTPSSFSALGNGSQQRNSNFKFAMLAAQSTLATMPRSREENRNLKFAIAELYAACNRNFSFGDLWIMLTAPEADDTSTLALPNLRNGSSAHQWSPRSETTSTAGNTSQRQGSRRIKRRASLNAAASNFSDPVDSLAMSPLETMTLEALRRRTTGNGSTNPIDWADAFNRFDHRRFASFGIVHGLLIRMHSFPYFPGVFPDSPIESKQDDRAKSEHSSRASFDIAEGSDGSYNLARKVALLMDGTRCDDEFVCQFEKPYQELVDLVEKFGGRRVVSVYASPSDR